MTKLSKHRLANNEIFYLWHNWGIPNSRLLEVLYMTELQFLEACEEQKWLRNIILKENGHCCLFSFLFFWFWHKTHN